MLSIRQLHSAPLLGGFALQDINADVLPMQNVALIGATGTGKSTLLKIIAGFVQHQQGTIHFEHKLLEGPDYQLIAGASGIAYLSQHFELLHNYKMQDLLAYKNEFTAAENAELYALCKIEHLMQRNSKQLSGGEKQRIALAKLLVAKPKLLILDEPYTNLDNGTKNMLKAVIKNVCARYNITCLLSSHDPLDVLPWADVVWVIENGKIIQTDTPLAVYTNPVNEYTASLLGEYSVLSNEWKLQLGIMENIWCVRPHQIAIVEHSTVKATVLASDYLGFHYKTIVVANGDVFTCYTNKKYMANNEVYLAISL
jgi:ABC-type sulfate/molybdate transport systems ATPase subunit